MGEAPGGIAARNRAAHRETTNLQIAAEFAACFGIAEGQPLPRDIFRPKISSEPDSGRSGVRLRPDIAVIKAAQAAAMPDTRRAAP